QTSASIAARRGSVRLHECLEDMLLFLLRDTDSGVGHDEMQDYRVALPGVDLDRYHHLSRRGEFDGVPRQVHQNLAKPVGVGIEGAGNVGREVAEKLESFLVRA